MASYKPIEGEPTVKAKYIGNPANKGHGPDELTTHGVTFPKGQFVDVPRSLADERLSKSRHFVVQGDKHKLP